MKIIILKVIACNQLIYRNINRLNRYKILIAFKHLLSYLNIYLYLQRLKGTTFLTKG